MTFIKLKKFILVSNLQRTYALCGLMILMSNFVTPHAVAENKTTLLDTYVFSTSPIFWGSPIVPVEYDETGDHGHILARARAFAAFYAMASEEAALGPIAGGMFENADNIAPTFGMVVADFETENGKLTFPLKNKLEIEWGDAPVSVLLSDAVIYNRPYTENTTKRNYCNFLGDGDFTDESRKTYNLRAFVILAHSSLPDKDMMTCFRNSIAFMFGLLPPVIEAVLEMDPREVMVFDFGVYPQVLVHTSICRKDKPSDVLGCTIEALTSGHKRVVNDILGAEYDVSKL